MFLALISGCTTQKVRTEGLNSWHGHNVIELKTHPYFSILPVEKREESSSGYVLNFTEKKIKQVGPTSCVGVGSSFGVGSGLDLGLGSSFCSERKYVEDNCIHQFTVFDEKVIDYNVLGKNECSTTCRNTPESHICKNK